MKRILVTGNQGYIGCVLTSFLNRSSYEVIGLDAAWYQGCALESLEKPKKQILKDIRQLTPSDLEDIDAVLHLAALCNDPLGEFKPGITEAINLKACLRLASLAKAAGVKRFVYVSSQSMYGVAQTDIELDEDKSDKNPITAYARTKWEAECAMKSMNDSKFSVVFARPSTVFGASPMLRCDIVFNSFVACAYTTGKIEIKSDGTPWRPVVHVRDLCLALQALLEAPQAQVAGEAFNIGIPNGNFTVRELAEAASRAVQGSELIFTGEHGSDARTYRVSFKKILSSFPKTYVPEWDLNRGARELVEMFDRIDFNEAVFRGPKVNRLKHIHSLIEEGVMDETWMRKESMGAVAS